MQNKKVEKILNVLRENGLPDNQFRELVVISDRMTNILTVLGMNGVRHVVTDLKTVSGRQPLIVIECEVALTKPAIQIVTDVLKSFAMISVQDEQFEKEDKYSGHLLYLMRKLDNAVFMHIEVPFWDGCVSALGNRSMMKFLDAVTG